MHSSLQPSENIFGVLQEGPNQQYQNLHGYVPSKQLGGVSTPTGFKQVGLANTSGDFYNFAENG